MSVMHASILRPVDTETRGTLVDPNLAPKVLDPTTNAVVAILKDAYDVQVTDEMISGTAGQEILDFKMPFHSAERGFIQTEWVIEAKGSRFHVRTPWDGWDSGSPVSICSVHCEALWYLLGEGDPITMAKQTTAAGAIGQILNNTGWTAGVVEVSAAGGSLTIVDKTSPLAALRLVPQAFGGELEFDNINKKVHLRQQRGSSSIVAMYAHGRNLVGNARTEDTTNLVTRLYVQGAQAVDSHGVPLNNPDGTPKYVDITTVNGGLPYLEDYSFYTSRNLPQVIRAATVVADTISDPQTLKDWGQAQLDAMSKTSYSYSIQQSNTGENDVEPALGDVVRVHDDDLGIDVNARVQQRVINVRQPWNTKYTLDTGLFTLSNALVGVGGGTVGGGGAGGGTAADSTVPNAPTSVTIAATATAVDYGSILMMVEASWTAVTANTDNTPIADLDHYDVEYQLTTRDVIRGNQLSAWTQQSVPAGQTSALITLTIPNSLVTVRVRAVDVSGNASGWTTQGPQTIVPSTAVPAAPSAPTLVGTPFAGTVTVAWDGLDVNGLARPADFVRLDVHVGNTAAFVPTSATLTDQLTAPGNSVLSIAPGVNYVRFVMVNTSLQQSAPSASLQVTTRQVVNTDIFDGAVGDTKLANAIITNAKINYLDLNTGVFSTLQVDRISSGYLSAQVTVSGRIKTADTGARAEMSGTGFYLIDGNGNTLLNASIVGGAASVSIIGDIKAGSTLPITTYTEQLLPNGNMEDVAPSAGLPLYWVLDGISGSGASAYIETGGNVLSGTRSLTFSIPNNNTGIGYRNSKYVPVTAGERLVAKVDVKIVNGTAGQNTLYLRVHWLDANGNPLTTGSPAAPLNPQVLRVDGTYVATPPTGTNPGFTDISSGWTGWQPNNTYRLAGEVIVPTGAVYADVCIYAWTSGVGGGQTYYIWDNATLMRAGVGSSIHGGYVTGNWFRTGESGKRIEMGLDRGLSYAYNVIYFYTGYTYGGQPESIPSGPFYQAIYSGHPMQGYVAADATTPSGGTDATGQLVGTLRLQSPKLTGDTTTDTYSSIMIQSTILDPVSGILADTDKVTVTASRFYFNGSAKGENQVHFVSWLNNQRVALYFDDFVSTNPIAILSTTTAASQYLSGGSGKDLAITTRNTGSMIGIGHTEGGGGTWFHYAGNNVIGNSVQNVAFSWAAATQVNVNNFANSAFAQIRAANVALSSSLQSKHAIEPLNSGWALDVIKKAPAYKWKYVPEEFAEHVNEPDRIEDGRVVRGLMRAAADPHEQWHFGPMWEDVHEDVRAHDEGLDLRDLIGVLWAAVDELSDEVAALREKVPA